MVRYLSLLMIFPGLFLNGEETGAQDQNSLGSSLAICYLKNIKKLRNGSLYKDDTIEQIIFGKDKDIPNGGISLSSYRASFHDVTLSVDRKKSHNKEEITLTAHVFGAPEEFKGENILESEKALVKYRIITAYLAYKTKMNERSFGWLLSDGMLDSTTHVTSSPSNYSESVFMNPYARRVYTDKYEMTVSSIFTVSEFDALIQKHCIDFEVAYDKYEASNPT